MTNETIKTIGQCVAGVLGLALISTLAMTSYNKGVRDANKNFLNNSKFTTRDLNSDGLADIVVEQNSGDKTVYYNTESGYLTAEQMKQREIQKIEQSYQEQLRQINEFYKIACDGNNIR